MDGEVVEHVEEGGGEKVFLTDEELRSCRGWEARCVLLIGPGSNTENLVKRTYVAFAFGEMYISNL